MYVCICNALREERVRRAIRASTEPLTPADLYQKLGVNMNCGKCLGKLEEVLSDELAKLRVDGSPDEL